MIIDLTFDHFKYIMGGVLAAVLFIGRYVYAEIRKFVKTQKDFIESQTAVNLDKTFKLDTIINNQVEISSQVKQLQILMEAQFEINPIALFICDGKGRCTHANDSLLQIFKSTEESMKGLGWMNYLHPEDRPRVMEIWFSAIESKNNSVRDHYRIIDRVKYESGEGIEIITTVTYKTILKYDNVTTNLEIAVGTVWEIDKQEINDALLKCLADTFLDFKGTPMWHEMQTQIRKKKHP